MKEAQILGRLGGLVKSPAKTESSRNNGLFGGRPPVVQMNPDGISVKGCSYIYAPRGQAAEYAPLASNPYRGCSHGCKYCYVPKALRMQPSEFFGGAMVRPSYLDGLRKDAAKYASAGITEQVMLSFTCDPYPVEHHLETRLAIQILQTHGLGVCCLTKGGSRALRDLDLFRPDRDCFSSTLTTLDDSFSRQWEPGAALPADRIGALRRFHDAGIFTWVSLEPTLDVASSEQIIRATHGFVDLYKIGRANYLPMTATTDWERYTLRMMDVVAELGIAHYFKKDLQCHLPSGYPNVLRQVQHH